MLVVLYIYDNAALFRFASGTLCLSFPVTTTVFIVNGEKLWQCEKIFLWGEKYGSHETWWGRWGSEYGHVTALNSDYVGHEQNVSHDSFSTRKLAVINNENYFLSKNSSYVLGYVNLVSVRWLKPATDQVILRSAFSSNSRVLSSNTKLLTNVQRI